MNKTPEHKRLLRQRLRGSLLLEAVLALAVAMSLIGISASFISSEGQRQERIMIASEQDVLLEASRNFVQERYHDVLMDLYGAADAGGDAIIAYSMDDLIEAGFLPNSYNGGIINAMYGQEFALLARAVNRTDGGMPQDTMTFSDIDPSAEGGIAIHLTDGDPSNGEMEIESILVTHGGEDLSPSVTGDVIGMMKSAFGGVVTEPGLAKGAYENFRMDITGFDELDAYPDPGHFAGVVSLSSYGILGSSVDREFVIDPFQRCVGVNIASAEYTDCIASNEVYTDLVLRPYDSDNNGSLDRFPAMRNVTFLDCADGSNTGAMNGFTIDCMQTTINGDLSVVGPNINLAEMSITPGNVTFQGRNVLTQENMARPGSLPDLPVTNVTGGRIVSEALNGGQDLTETISGSRVVRAGDLVEKPICPARALDGSTPMEPRIYVSPAAYADQRGRPVVGVRAFAEEASSTHWRTRVLIYVAQDFCNSDASDPLNSATMTYYGFNGAPQDASRCSIFDSGTEAMTTSRADSRADVYELTGDSAAVIAQTRCY